MPQVYSAPARSVAKLIWPETATGVALFVVVPLPS